MWSSGMFPLRVGKSFINLFYATQPTLQRRKTRKEHLFIPMINYYDSWYPSCIIYTRTCAPFRASLFIELVNYYDNVLLTLHLCVT